RSPGRHDIGDFLGAVIIVRVVDGLLVEVGHQFVREPRHADLGVTHGGRGIPVHGAEVALPVHQRITQGEILGHAHDGFVNGGVKIGVVLTDHVTVDTGALLVVLYPVVGAYC